MRYNPVMLPAEIRTFIESDVYRRFAGYVKIHTTSDPDSSTKPSTGRQMELLQILASELSACGLRDVELDAQGFVYATLPASTAVSSGVFGLMAHIDTSPDQSGEKVRPVRHDNWDGSPIRFEDDPELTLSSDDSAELQDFLHDTIITAAGRTLLGADDKAGVAEIMTALAVFQKFPQLPHGEIRICFTSDEEVGKGTVGMDLSRLPKYLYTMDGGYPGELETECFDAWRVELEFQGRGVHPGYAFGKMVNAVRAAAVFAARLPPAELPETTRERQGFFHLTDLAGNNEKAVLRLIIRDFEQARNEERLERLNSLKCTVEKEFPGLVIRVTSSHQYENMGEVLNAHKEVVELAVKAIEDTGLAVIRKAIRGGTDGSRLSRLGHPTPNIFAGGLLFHSRKEYVALSSMVKAVETIVHLARRWSQAAGQVA